MFKIGDQVKLRKNMWRVFKVVEINQYATSDHTLVGLLPVDDDNPNHTGYFYAYELEPTTS